MGGGDADRVEYPAAERLGRGSGQRRRRRWLGATLVDQLEELGNLLGEQKGRAPTRDPGLDHREAAPPLVLGEKAVERIGGGAEAGAPIAEAGTGVGGAKAVTLKLAAADVVEAVLEIGVTAAKGGAMDAGTPAELLDGEGGEAALEAEVDEGAAEWRGLAAGRRSP